jgi:AcrR family transcriptional regulator
METVKTSPGNLTRKAILKAGYLLFKEQGYHGTSMRQIAESAEIALGGIYNHFGSKEEIFSTVLVEYHPAHEVIPAVLENASKDIEDFVRYAARIIMTKLTERPDFLNLMFIELVEFRSQHIPILYDEIFPKGLEMVRAVAANQKGIRTIPIDVMLRAFLGLMFSLIISQALLGQTVRDVGSEVEIEHYVEIFLHGILMEDQV